MDLGIYLAVPSPNHSISLQSFHTYYHGTMALRAFCSYSGFWQRAFSLVTQSPRRQNRPWQSSWGVLSDSNYDISEMGRKSAGLGTYITYRNLSQNSTSQTGREWVYLHRRLHEDWPYQQVWCIGKALGKLTGSWLGELGAMIRRRKGDKKRLDDLGWGEIQLTNRFSRTCAFTLVSCYTDLNYT